jgi:aminoglycoside phosphotransferase (APT) family kinase protein
MPSRADSAARASRAPTARPPALLARAIAALGIAVDEVAPLLNDEPWTAQMRTFRLTTEEGELLKARLSRSARRVATSARLTVQLNDPRLPPPAAQWGRVTFERWVAGTPLNVTGWSERELIQAAELLGAVHRFAGARGEHLPQQRATRPFVEASLPRLSRLRRAGLIDRSGAGRIAGLLRGGIPERAAWGLTHGDLAPANLILTASGQLISIDNERLGRGFFDLDLAGAWHRWPLPEPDQRRFDTAYAVAAGRSPSPAIALWRLLATIRRLGLRIASGGDISDARRRLGDALDGL